MLNVSFRNNFIAKLPSIRLLNIPNIREFSNSTFCGPPALSVGTKAANLLRELGVRDIIDFREDAPKAYELLCKRNGFGYFRFPLDSVENVRNTDYYIKSSADSYRVSNLLMNLLQKYLRMMRRGHVYAGCQYGIDRTNKALTINYFLGNAQKPPRLLHWDDETQKAVVNRNVRIVNKIFRHLTPEQKTALGLPESFKDLLSEKMGNFILKNRG